MKCYLSVFSRLSVFSWRSKKGRPRIPLWGDAGLSTRTRKIAFDLGFPRTSKDRF